MYNNYYAFLESFYIIFLKVCMFVSMYRCISTC